jgi:origin recognition complex subunit 1
MLVSAMVFLSEHCTYYFDCAYSDTVLWRGLSGHTLSSKAALKSLKGHFSASKNIPADRPIVCLVDELDFLITRSLEVVYQFYDWSSTKDFVLITIANTMDLPERLSTR